MDRRTMLKTAAAAPLALISTRAEALTSESPLAAVGRQMQLLASSHQSETTTNNEAQTASAEETPVEKVNRLGWELAHAMNEYWDGKMHAVVYPSDQRELAVGFLVTDLHIPPMVALKNQIEMTKEAMAKAYPEMDVYAYTTIDEDNGRPALIFTTSVDGASHA